MYITIERLLLSSLPFPSDDERSRLRAAWCEGDEERGPRRRGLRGVGGGEVCGALVAAKWAGRRGLVEGAVGERAGASGLGCGRTGVEGAGAGERRLVHIHGSGRNLYS